MMAAVVDAGKLLDVVLTSLASGVGVISLFSLAVLGATRASDRRGAARGVSLAYAGLATLSLAGCVAAVGYGVVLLSQK
jgi:hypothetical protein